MQLLPGGGGALDGLPLGGDQPPPLLFFAVLRLAQLRADPAAQVDGHVQPQAHLADVAVDVGRPADVADEFPRPDDFRLGVDVVGVVEAGLTRIVRVDGERGDAERTAVVVGVALGERVVLLDRAGQIQRRAQLPGGGVFGVAGGGQGVLGGPHRRQVALRALLRVLQGRRQAGRLRRRGQSAGRPADQLLEAGAEAVQGGLGGDHVGRRDLLLGFRLGEVGPGAVADLVLRFGVVVARLERGQRRLAQGHHPLGADQIQVGGGDLQEHGLLHVAQAGVAAQHLFVGLAQARRVLAAAVQVLAQGQLQRGAVAARLGRAAVLERLEAGVARGAAQVGSAVGLGLHPGGVQGRHPGGQRQRHAFVLGAGGLPGRVQGRIAPGGLAERLADGQRRRGAGGRQRQRAGERQAQTFHASAGVSTGTAGRAGGGQFNRLGRRRGGRRRPARRDARERAGRDEKTPPGEPAGLRDGKVSVSPVSRASAARCA